MLYLLFSAYGPSDFGNLFRALRGSTGFFMRPMAPSFFGSVLKLCSRLLKLGRWHRPSLRVSGCEGFQVCCRLSVRSFRTLGLSV